MLNDVRAAVRHFQRRPGHSSLALITLAVGLAASTAVFTYVNAYSRPFPGAQVDAVRQVFLTSNALSFEALSFPDFEDIARATEGRYEVAAVGRSQFAASVRHEQLTEVAYGQAVTGSFFALLEVQMALGRGISPQDDSSGADPVVVISERYWAQRYGSDPQVLGRTLLLNNEPYTIVGVSGPEFVGTSSAYRPQFWLPFEQYARVYWARSDNRTNREVRAVVPLIRPRTAASPALLTEMLSEFARNLDREAPLRDGTRTFTDVAATWISPATRAAESTTTRILQMAAAALLLLSCANVAALVLTAGARRRGEMAVRAAMGASRWRLMRPLLLESALLASGGGALAVLIAPSAAARLGSYFDRPSVWGSNVPREVTMDGSVLGFAIVVAFASAIVTGMLPAFRVADRSPAKDLATGRISGRSRRPRRGVGALLGSNLLVSTQIAIAVVLLFVSGLTLRTLRQTSAVQAGFDTTHTVASYVSTSSMGIAVEDRHRFFEELIQRFERVPWVEAATVAEAAPLSAHTTLEIRVEGVPRLLPVTRAQVWPGFFDAIGMELRRGRALLATDTASVAGVVVVNETLARSMSADGNPLGQTVWWPGENGETDRGFDVVGVVRDIRQVELLDDPPPTAYFSLPQHYSSPGNALLLRVTVPPSQLIASIEQELRDIDTRIAIVNVLPYDDVVRGFLYTQHMNAEMFAVTAGLGLLLAAAGIFGVVAMAVGRRRREIGIRMAVGADRPSILRLVLRGIAGPIGIGLVLGALACWAIVHRIEPLLWGVSSSDPKALVGGALVLIVAIGLALGAPLFRALSVDPAESLQVE